MYYLCSIEPKYGDMDCEKQTTEYKGLLKIRTGDKGFKDLSVTCVALANAQGGRIFIGYDDKKKAPLPEQHVTPDEVNELSLIHI